MEEGPSATCGPNRGAVKAKVLRQESQGRWKADEALEVTGWMGPDLQGTGLTAV